MIDRALPVVGGAIDHLADVGTRAERLPGAGDDDGAHLGVAAGRFERFGERVEQRQVDGVELVGAVECQAQRAGAPLEQQGFAHRVLLRIA